MFDYTDDEDAPAPSVVSEGQAFPTRHNALVQANAGYGEAPSMPQYNPAAYPLAPLGRGRGMGASPDGIGTYSLLNQMPTPTASNNGVLGRVLSGSPLIRGLRAMSGLGDDAAATTTTTTTTPAGVQTGTAVAAASGLLVAAVAVGLVLTGVGSYYVGKAVAPSRDKQSKYAWWGVAAGLLGGPLGLGIEAIIALEHK